MPAGTRKPVMPLSVWTRAGISCLWSTSSWKRTPSASFQRAKRPERNGTTMKLEQLKKRLDKQRPMTTISMRFPVDVLDDLKRVAPLRGFSGYQPLIRAYVGQGELAKRMCCSQSLDPRVCGTGTPSGLSTSGARPNDSVGGEF